MPTEEEIKEAVWSCDPSKALGSDGFNFIRKSWEIVGADFKKVILDFFNTSSLENSLNMTWVTLIPKFEGAKEMKDFRPISMVGCVYKIIAMILARRIRKVMGGLIGEA